jgi:hypothetical protein
MAYSMEIKREKATPTIPWSDAVDGPDSELNNGRAVDAMTPPVLHSQGGR